MTDTIDQDALRARYREERDKRLRADGNEQYVELTGRFAEYLEDPYVQPAPREPFTDDVTVAFIGGGFAGLVTAAKLRQAGIDDVRIIEKGGDFGGTWYWNRYPGAQCDTASFIYMPLLEETGHMPTEKYVHAPEILEHCRTIGRTFGLYDNAALSTEVTGLDWDDDAARWNITTNRATGCGRGSWRWAPARCTGRSCRVSPASRRSRVTASTRVDGTTTTPAATLPVVR